MSFNGTKEEAKVIISEESMEDEVVLESPIQDDQMGHSSPVRDSSLKSNLEATGNPDSTVETSKVDTPINLGEQIKTFAPKQTNIIPPGVSTTESIYEEVRTLGITANISNMDANVTMGEGVSNTAAQGNPHLVVISTFETSLIDIPTSTNSPASTHSPTFDNIMQQPITSLFSSQSTEGPNTVNDDETDHGGFDGSFSDIEFDRNEEDIPDHMMMPGKQFKILNQKLNSLLQL